MSDEDNEAMKKLEELKLKKSDLQRQLNSVDDDIKNCNDTLNRNHKNRNIFLKFVHKQKSYINLIDSY